jgi:predicted RecB family endonuclease
MSPANAPGSVPETSPAAARELAEALGVPQVGEILAKPAAVEADLTKVVSAAVTKAVSERVTSLHERLDRIERVESAARECYRPPADPTLMAKAAGLRSKAAGLRQDADRFANPNDVHTFHELALEGEQGAAEVEQQARGGIRR